MAPVIFILAAGYFVGGYLGDLLFKRTKKGRILISCAGVLLGAAFLYLAMTTPLDRPNQFFILMCLTAIFLPLFILIGLPVTLIGTPILYLVARPWLERLAARLAGPTGEAKVEPA